MARIETGVDRLVALVAKEKKIELSAAAKSLNVDPAVVREWAEFLEEEGILSLEYSLSKVFLVEKRLTKTEIAKKEKEYDGKREAFVRRVDATLKQLEDETAGFESIKKQYDTVKQHIGDEIDAVKEELEQLRHYEELKKSIDADILKQKVEYQKTIDEVRTRIGAEERRYTKVIGEITEQQKHIDEERSEFADIKREELDLAKRIEALQDIVNNVQTRLSAHKGTLEAHEQRLLTLRELADKLREDIVEKRKKEIEPLLKVSDGQAGRILRIQDEIVQKVKAGRDKMQEFESQSKEIADRFGAFFDKRARTEQTIKELEKAKLEMKEQLNELIRKAKAFEITGKSDTNAHIKELEGKFQEFDRRRGAFSKQLESLKEIILGKGGKRSTESLAAAEKKVEKAMRNVKGKGGAKKSSAPKKPSRPTKKKR